jgi:hypothetical protein
MWIQPAARREHATHLPVAKLQVCGDQMVNGGVSTYANVRTSRAECVSNINICGYSPWEPRIAHQSTLEPLKRCRLKAEFGAEDVGDLAEIGNYGLSPLSTCPAFR